MMRYRFFFCLILCLMFAVTGLLVWGRVKADDYERTLAVAQRELVGRLQLTDLSIWTEARYSRHPSQSDIFTPFQDFPGSLEHFPSGALLAPPRFNLTTTFDVISSSARRP